jgi:L-aspartate oxidase
VSERGPAALDVLVVGSGVAGLSAAVRLAEVPGLRVGVLTKGELSASTTRWAQGGVAAVLGGQDEDSVDLHQADTLAAGAGLCDVEAVRVLVSEGPRRVHELIALGAVFDRARSGALALAREGGHSTARVVHAGGAATGAEVERTLVDAVSSTAAAIMEGWFAEDLVVDGGRCRGLVAIDPEGRRHTVVADHVILAAGGTGQLFAVTTNPPEATGDGVAMALRAQVPVADVEFVQFHPTALHHPAMPRPLLSEALRGHGAVLRDASGERFVDELAPRDVVSRAMAATMAAQGVDHLWLDATGLSDFEIRFPTLAASLHGVGLDPSRDWLPIAPAAHHVAGGVLTDLDGATPLAGLWAVGEVACSGVHGANRLASNSLLEGMVFGARAAEAVAAGKEVAEPTGALAPLLARPAGPAGSGASGPSRDHPGPSGPSAVPVVPVHPAASAAWAVVEDPLQSDLDGRVADRAPGWAGAGPGQPGTPAGSAAREGAELDALRGRLQGAMTAGAGLVRSAASLEAAAAVVAETARAVAGSQGRTTVAVPGAGAVAAGELANLATVAWALVRAAVCREETRGAHTREEHPEPDPRWRVRLVHGSRLGGNLAGSGALGGVGAGRSEARRG